MEVAARYGGWVSDFTTVKGKETADGSAMAGKVVALRRDACPVVVDGGGGYGGGITMRLQDNGIEAVVFKGADGSSAVTNDAAKLTFFNRAPRRTGACARPSTPTRRAGPSWRCRPTTS